jgi:transposase, IS5 family
MSKPRDERQKDLFRSALDQFIDMGHPLVRLAQRIDWRRLEQSLDEVYRPGPGHPPLPTRLIAGMMILKSHYALSDGGLCERWIESPYFQFFCGEEVFRHELPFERSSLTRWRRRMGKERIATLMRDSLAAARSEGEREVGAPLGAAS